MKRLTLTISAAIGCMAILMVSGAAIARPNAPKDIDEIIIAYCDEVAQNVSAASPEIEDATEDVLACPADLDACLLDLSVSNPPSDCIRDYERCVRSAETRQSQACTAFVREFRQDTSDATKAAKRNRVEDEWFAFLESDSTQRNLCLDPALFLTDLCAFLNPLNQ